VKLPPDFYRNLVELGAEDGLIKRAGHVRTALMSMCLLRQTILASFGQLQISLHLFGDVQVSTIQPPHPSSLIPHPSSLSASSVMPWPDHGIHAVPHPPIEASG
jgi:hypothetical protein